MSATLRDVAAAAGVHAATASRALNPETLGMVNPATAKRVREAAERLGYVPNPIARSLKTNRTLSLGAVVPDITNPLFAPIIRGIEDVAVASGYNVLIANTDNEPDRERDQVASLRARQVDGLILATARIEDPVISTLIADRVPIVLVNRVEPDLPIFSVAGDDASGIRQALRHLYELGHRRIAHIAGPSTTSTGVVRRRTFQLEVGELGLAVEDCPIVEAASYQIEDGAGCLRAVLDAHPGVTAVLAANDLLAIGCYEVLAELGLTCPADLSVIGFNDIPFVDKVWPPLTTVHVRHYDFGAEAARLVLEQLRDPEISPKSVLLSVSLVVRGSTAAPRA